MKSECIYGMLFRKCVIWQEQEELINGNTNIWYLRLQIVRPTANIPHRFVFHESCATSRAVYQSYSTSLTPFVPSSHNLQNASIFEKERTSCIVHNLAETDAKSICVRLCI